MPIRKVQSKRFKGGVGYKLTIDRRGLRLSRTFQRRSDAEAVERSLLGRLTADSFGLPIESKITLAELIEKHLEVLAKKGRAAVRAKTVLNCFADLTGPLRRVSAVRHADLQCYVEHRLECKWGKKKDRPVSPQSINREMNEIKSCLSGATRYYSELEDWSPPKGAWLEEPHDGRRQTWSNEEIEAVLRELYAPMRPKEKADHVRGRRAVGDMFLLALCTGLRAGEVRRLKRQDIDLRRKTITVTSRKGAGKLGTARRRDVPMSELAMRILERRLPALKGDCMFPGNSPDVPLADHRKAFMTACRRAGINYGFRAEGALIFNDARRTMENRILEAGFHARIAGDILGHSAETMAKHYARSTNESRRKAVEAVGNFGAISGLTPAQAAQDAEAAQGKKPDEEQTDKSIAAIAGLDP